tara:strand:+ start:568 stop:750 length:183 start_codon:yes stop_codon:yes gene_type:complete
MAINTIRELRAALDEIVAADNEITEDSQIDVWDNNNAEWANICELEIDGNCVSFNLNDWR